MVIQFISFEMNYFFWSLEIGVNHIFKLFTVSDILSGKNERPECGVAVDVRKSWYLDMAQKKKDKWNALAEKIRLIIFNLVKVNWSEYVLPNTDNPSLKKSERKAKVIRPCHSKVHLSLRSWINRTESQSCTSTTTVTFRRFNYHWKIDRKHELSFRNSEYFSGKLTCISRTCIDNLVFIDNFATSELLVHDWEGQNERIKQHSSNWIKRNI